MVSEPLWGAKAQGMRMYAYVTVCYSVIVIVRLPHVPEAEGTCSHPAQSCIACHEERLLAYCCKVC